MRQPVDQVEVDAADACLREALRRARGLFEALDAVDRLLHDGIEALHAKARPRDAASEGHDHRPFGVSVRGSISIAISA